MGEARYERRSSSGSLASSLPAAAPRPVSRAARVAWLPLSKAAD